MLRKTLKVLAWVAGGLIGVCIAFYLVVVAINWRDAEPSAVALRMANDYRDRPAVRDEDNAFVFAMGFNVPSGENPHEMGLKRLACLRHYEGSTELDFSADTLGDPPDHRAAVHPTLRTYLEACSPGIPGCAVALVNAGRTFEEWEDSEDWLMQRYRAFLALPSWREETSTDIAAPIPAYQVVMDGQKVLLLHVRNYATHGDPAAVRELLGEELRFWRRMLATSDGLVSKMIATAAIKRHFKVGAEAIALLPPGRVSEALPAEWHVELSEAELSMRRVMVGEWVFVSGTIRDLGEELAEVLPAQDTIIGTLRMKLGQSFYQPQDTINCSADQISRTIDLLPSASLSEYEAAANRLAKVSMAAGESCPRRFLYNVPGRTLVGIGPGYGSYVRRLGDIEGVRRAALAAIALHESKVPLDEIPEALVASTLRNPYDGEPFTWDATDNAVVFRGLEPGERGEHRIH